MESPIGKSVAFNDFISSLALNSVEQNSNSLPAVDRFVNLAMQLENPSFSSSYLTNKLASELNLAYGIGSDKKNLAYNLLSDKEYMMKFQVVSLAKHHNYYGHMDTYMKQFCNVIVQNGDRQAVKTLERVMNAEVSIRNPKTTELLN